MGLRGVLLAGAVAAIPLAACGGGKQPNAPANRAAVIASAQKLYHRVHG